MVRGLLALLVALALLGGATGCARPETAGETTRPASGSAIASGPVLPDSAYHRTPDLPEWSDPLTGAGVAAEWRMDGRRWPIGLVMSPSQSPQLLAGLDADLFGEHLETAGITPGVERIDGAPRTFHALQRSRWPFVYMPIATFVEYSRSPENRGGAGGLQYVAIAGSTAGGGYDLLARDPGLRSVAGLGGKRIVLPSDDAMAGAYLTRALEAAGLDSVDGSRAVHLSFADAGDEATMLAGGECDGIVVPSSGPGGPVPAGLHRVRGASDEGYLRNATILCVERTVLERRPEVVDAFLRAHWEAHRLSLRQWKPDGLRALQSSWNDFYSAQPSGYSDAAPVRGAAAYAAMLGDAVPEVRLDRRLIADSLAFSAAHGMTRWPGRVDAARLVDFEAFNRVLSDSGAGIRQ